MSRHIKSAGNRLRLIALFFLALGYMSAPTWATEDAACTKCGKTTCDEVGSGEKGFNGNCTWTSEGNCPWGLGDNCTGA